MQKPGGVVASAFLVWFNAVVSLLLGYLMTFNGFEVVRIEGGVAEIVNQFGFIFGLITMSLGALLIFLGFGVFWMREWARSASIVICLVGTFTSLFNFNFISVVSNTLVAIYMILPSTREAFDMADYAPPNYVPDLPGTRPSASLPTKEETRLKMTVEEEAVPVDPTLKKCPRCGLINGPNQKQCKRCAEWLPDEVATY